MEFRINDLKQIMSASLVTPQQDGTLVLSINGKERQLKMVSFNSDQFEFILENKFYSIKLIEAISSHIKLIINGQQVMVKKHSKLTEILEKSLALIDNGSGENRLSSQIPGRVVSVLAKIGTEVKKGDSIVILESMKMQVAVKAHKDGLIKEIRTKEGSTVARYDIVAVIE
ncbi:MAG: biotin/lipoyl-binding protein [Thermoproteota archaeon]|nr:biotin/lipoyl-binding protein [Thermoproteota archaeon]